MALPQKNWKQVLENLDAQEIQALQELPPLPVEFRGIHWLARFRKDPELIVDILHPTVTQGVIHSWTIDSDFERPRKAEDAAYIRTSLKYLTGTSTTAAARTVTLYIVEQVLHDKLFVELDRKLKRPLLWFLMGSIGRLDAERKLPRHTRLHESRNNSVRRFFDHYMFEEKLLPVISGFLWDPGKPNYDEKRN